MTLKGFKKYKHLGLLPIDWEVCNANDACVKITDGTHDTPVPTKAGVPYIKSVHIKKGKVEFGKCFYLEQRDHDVIYKRCNPQSGDLLIVNIGAGNVGDCAYVDVDFEFSMKNVALLKPNPNVINKLFLYQYYQSIKDKVVHITKTGGAQPFLSIKDLKRLKIVIPPLVEQEKISRILSTWDQAIEVTEKLIISNRKQKKALMQQLLTGKKRLLGFSDEWEIRMLGDLGEIKSAGVDKKIIDGEKFVRLLNFTDVFRRNFIYSCELNHWVTAPEKKVFECNVEFGDIFFTPSSETRNDAAISAVAAEKVKECCYSYHVVRFRMTQKWDLNYKAFAFSVDGFRRQAYRLADGSGQRYVISQGNFRKMLVTFPQYREQVEIGKVLKAAEEKIEILQKNLDALKQEKKALMQQLLTGKRRVKIDEEAA